MEKTAAALIIRGHRFIQRHNKLPRTTTKFWIKIVY